MIEMTVFYQTSLFTLFLVLSFLLSKTYIEEKENTKTFMKETYGVDMEISNFGYISAAVTLVSCIFIGSFALAGLVCWLSSLIPR